MKKIMMMMTMMMMIIIIIIMIIIIIIFNYRLPRTMWWYRILLNVSRQLTGVASE